MRLRVPKKILALTLCFVLGLGSAFSVLADENAMQTPDAQEGASVSGNEAAAYKDGQPEGGETESTGAAESQAQTDQAAETVSGNSVSGSDLVYQDERVTIHVRTQKKLGEDVTLSAARLADEDQAILISLLKEEDRYGKTLRAYEPYHLELEGEGASEAGELQVSFAVNGHETDEYTKLFGLAGTAHEDLGSGVTAEGATVRTTGLGDFVAAAYVEPVYLEQEWEPGVNYTEAAPLVGEKDTEYTFEEEVLEEGPLDFSDMLRSAMFATNQPVASLMAAGDLMGGRLRSGGTPRDGGNESDGLIIDKKVEKDGDNYKLTLEAYITGKISTTVEHVPADIVMVLDVSGSMGSSFGNSTIYVQVDNPVMTNTYFYLLYYQGKPMYLETVYNNGWYYNAPDGSGPVYITTGTPVLPAGTVLYQSQTSNLNRMQALKSAAKDFINLVEADAQYNNVNHRIAVTTFASNSQTGVYVGSQFYGRGSAATAHYGEALRNTIATAAGGPSQISDVRTSINVLNPGGGTLTRLGMEMARGVISNTPLLPGETKRNRIVILFTDGETQDNTSQKTEGIQHAYTIKNDYSGTVYCVSVLPGANPNGTSTNDMYMKYLSSLYPQAQSWTNPGAAVPPATGSYYLTANDTAGLSGVFENIFNQLSTPDIELGPEAVMKDILSLEFELPNGSNSVKAYTADCTGQVGDTYTFGGKTPFPDANISINGRVVDVSNFDYGENFVAVNNGTPRGKKLILEIEIKPSDSFIGGGAVNTNNTESGIYDKDGGKLKSFPTPEAEVPSKFFFEVSKGSIYVKDQKDPQAVLFSLIDGDAARDGLQYRTAEGGTVYTLGEAVNGTIGNSQMNIAYEVRRGSVLVGTYTVPAGQKTGAWSGVTFKTEDLTEDADFTVTAVLTPVSGGTVVQKLPSNAQPKLYVFRPEVPVTDKTIFLGETTDITQCVTTTGITWKCDAAGSEAAAAQALLAQPAPVLSFDYTWTAGTRPDGTATQYTAFTPKLSSNFKLVVKKGTEDITALSAIQPNETMEDGVHELVDGANSLQPHDFTIHVLSGAIAIFKEIPAGSYNADEGDPVFTFRIDYTGEKGETETYYRVVRFHDASSETTGADSLRWLPKGTYKITELSTLRYDVTAIEQDALHTNCPVSVDGTRSITFEIGKTVTALDGWAKFTNTKTGNSPRLTDTDVRVNRFTVRDGEPEIIEDTLIENGGGLH